MSDRLRTMAMVSHFYGGLGPSEQKAMPLSEWNAYVAFMTEYRKAEAEANGAKPAAEKTTGKPRRLAQPQED